MAGVVCKAAGMAGTTGRYTSIASEASRSKGAISASAGGRDRPRCRGGQGRMGGHGKASARKENPAAICLDEAQRGAQ